MKICNFKNVENAGALTGKFDVELDSLIIHGMCLFSNSKGSIWISEPSDKWTDREGIVHYSKHLIITDNSLKTEIGAMVKQLLYDRDIAAGINRTPVELCDQDTPF